MGGGGMTVFLREPDEGFNVLDYNDESTEASSLKFVEGARALKIPYKQNRLVMFKSSLVHRTDPTDFGPGYASRRINYTLLFGLRSSRVDHSLGTLAKKK